MKKNIAVLPGDGIGPEIMIGALEILNAIGERFGHEFVFEYGHIGGTAIDTEGTPLSNKTIDLCKRNDAVLLGAVGGPKWDHNPPEMRPEQGLLKIRKELNLYANMRPISYYASIEDSSPLKKEIIEETDFLIVRELTGGLYFGKPSKRNYHDGKESAVDTLYYEREEVKRIITLAFELAKERKGKVTSVDKANVLESSRMWREVAEEVSSEFPNVKLEHMLVDNAAMQLIRNPRQFDIIVTENMFGDILSDEASVLTGSLGMLPSASLSENGLHLYEPIHGSAPDIAGQDKANPIAMILSVASMLRHSFQMEEEASVVEQAVKNVLDSGRHTIDLSVDGKVLSTTEMARAIKEEILQKDAIFHIMEAYA